MFPPEDEVSVDAINLGTREVFMADGTILPMSALHDDDGEETDDIDEATFATVELPDGSWIAVMFSNYVQRVLN